mmetsp:Transcript_113668/g.185257  ORF Transcript_113668/g.185257 Transcript_113668/m.185257 type:complete len:300 (-) Transcript_113668:30-929(-)
MNRGLYCNRSRISVLLYKGISLPDLHTANHMCHGRVCLRLPHVAIACSGDPLQAAPCILPEIACVVLFVPPETTAFRGICHADLAANRESIVAPDVVLVPESSIDKSVVVFTAIGIIPVIAALLVLSPEERTRDPCWYAVVSVQHLPLELCVRIRMPTQIPMVVYILHDCATFFDFSTVFPCLRHGAVGFVSIQACFAFFFVMLAQWAVLASCHCELVVWWEARRARLADGRFFQLHHLEACLVLFQGARRSHTYLAFNACSRTHAERKKKEDHQCLHLVYGLKVNHLCLLLGISRRKG